MHRAGRRTQSQIANCVSPLTSELCAIHVRPPPDQYLTITGDSPDPRRGKLWSEGQSPSASAVLSDFGFRVSFGFRFSSFGFVAPQPTPPQRLDAIPRNAQHPTHETASSRLCLLVRVPLLLCRCSAGLGSAVHPASGPDSLLAHRLRLHRSPGGLPRHAAALPRPRARRRAGHRQRAGRRALQVDRRDHHRRERLVAGRHRPSAASSSSKPCAPARSRSPRCPLNNTPFLNRDQWQTMTHWLPEDLWKRASTRRPPCKTT